MQASSHQQFLLGGIQVHVAHNSLHLGDRSVKLQPKAMAVLHYLAVHQERVVSAQELMEQLWTGRIVTQASVQKSINAIRSALHELQPQQEFIEFFSKRGYQLQIAAEFSAESQPLAEVLRSSRPSLYKRKPLWLAAASLLIVSVLLSWWFNTTPPIPKHHNTQFTQWQDYTQQAGHQRAATPHPDNEHIAYITEAFIDDQGNSQSQLLIRNAQGRDWQIARSDGSWFKLAWSPSGKQLAAVEVTRTHGRTLNPDFYEKPNFLYSIHFFTLDLANHQLVEKQTLSQWQGRIFSLGWWNEDVVEIVAKQGPNSGNARYHYSKLDQRLSQLDEINGIPNPYASAIHQKTTVLARNQGSKTQIDFVNDLQESIARYSLPYSHLNLGWIPDGSGILAYAADKQALLLLYRDGEQIPITLPEGQQGQLSRPVFGPAGDQIYFTQEQRKADIYQITLSGEKTNLTNNEGFNFLASFSPDGQRIIYGKTEGQKIQLVILENGIERLATKELLTERLGPIAWNAKGTEVFFNSGNGLYQLSLETQALILLHQTTDPVEAVGLVDNEQQLVFVKTQGDIRNLWILDLDTHQEKQLTFGSLGTTLVSDNSIYAQYVNAPGLWEIRGVNNAPKNINPGFPISSKLLAIANQTVYYLTGGNCHESAVLSMPLQGGEVVSILTRKTALTTTTSFHPDVGVLQTECYIPESRIVVLK